jgi:hypothetical protein
MGLSSEKSPLLIALATLLLAGLIIGFFALPGGSGIKRLDPFPVQDFMDSPDNFLGNRYRMEAQIEAQLSYREGVGRLIAIDPRETGTTARRLPVFVPSEITDTINVGQRYQMAVRIREGGLIEVEKLEKF